MSEETPSGGIDEERAALILDRAARLDAGRVREVDLGELRQAALEAGISPAAFRRAVAEVEAMAEAAATPGGGEAGSGGWPLPDDDAIRRRVMLAAAGLGLGSLPMVFREAFALGPESGLLFGLFLLVQLVGWLIYRHRTEGSGSSFLVDLTSLWVGLIWPLMFVDPDDAGAVVAVLSAVWVVVAVVGGVVARGGGDDDREERRSGRALPPRR